MLAVETGAGVDVNPDRGAVGRERGAVDNERNVSGSGGAAVYSGDVAIDKEGVVGAVAEMDLDDGATRSERGVADGDCVMVDGTGCLLPAGRRLKFRKVFIDALILLRRILWLGRWTRLNWGNGELPPLRARLLY